jgi:hypothetical protein
VIFQLQMQDTGQPLKVTLVWKDAPGLANQGGLQNVLYLQVRDPKRVVNSSSI